MGCYRPLVMYACGWNKDTDKPKFKFSGERAERSKIKDDGLSVIIPCKKCIGCRLDYSRAWADRLMLELDHSKTAVFVTLTYDNEHAVPAMYDDILNTWWYTLEKKHVQDFNKRLRYYFPDKEIRFFLAGEYGSKTLRPHYHAIYFGLSLDDFDDIDIFKYNEHMQPIYSSEWLDSVWSHGFTSIGSVSWQSCAYVARYALKKQKFGAIDALSRNCEPEFVLMSRRPGIAGYFSEEHPEIFESPRDPIFISDVHGVKSVNSVKMPKYLFEKLELINPELYAKIKKDKIEASNARFLEELSHTDLSEFDYLDMKERNHNLVENILLRSAI